MQSRCVSHSQWKGACSHRGRVLEGVARKGGVAVFRISLSGYVLICSKGSDLLHAEPRGECAIAFHHGLKLVDGGAVLASLLHWLLGSDLGVVVRDLVTDWSLGMQILEVRLNLTFLHHVSLHLECIGNTMADGSLGMEIFVN